jgi:hypothetical protein
MTVTSAGVARNAAGITLLTLAAGQFVMTLDSSRPSPRTSAPT